VQSLEYAPEVMLLVVGLFVGGFAIHFITTHRYRRAAGLGLASVACVLLAVALGKSDCTLLKYSESWRFKPSAFRRPLTPASPDSLVEERVRAA
jgi:hypothetical protein